MCGPRQNFLLPVWHREAKRLDAPAGVISWAEQRKYMFETNTPKSYFQKTEKLKAIWQCWERELISEWWSPGTTGSLAQRALKGDRDLDVHWKHASTAVRRHKGLPERTPQGWKARLSASCAVLKITAPPPSYLSWSMQWLLWWSDRGLIRYWRTWQVLGWILGVT